MSELGKLFRPPPPFKTFLNRKGIRWFRMEEDSGGLEWGLSQEKLIGMENNDKLFEDEQVKNEVPMGAIMEFAHAPKLKLVDGICVIFGLMVGSGIFSSAGLVYADVGSSGMSLLIWLATGLLALTGALWYVS